jgi:hypothetical protein
MEPKCQKCMAVFGSLVIGAIFIEECPFPNKDCVYKRHSEPHSHSELYQELPRQNSNVVIASTDDTFNFNSSSIIIISDDPKNPGRRTYWVDVSDESI